MKILTAGIFLAFSFLLLQGCSDSKLEKRVAELESQVNQQNKPTTAPSSQTYSEPSVPGEYPQGSTRYLSASDVNYLMKVELRLMRNEIYARHGYIFKSADLWRHFTAQKWYHPQYTDVNSMLSGIEKSNINLIKRYEKDADEGD